MNTFKSGTFIHTTASILLVIGYLAAGAVLFVGANKFIASITELNMAVAMAGFCISTTAFLIKILGWTVIPFTPLTAMVLRKLLHRLTRGPLSSQEKIDHGHVLEMCGLVGMIGTVVSFVLIGLGQQTGNEMASHQSSLSAFFIGCGSSVAGFSLALIGTPALLGKSRERATPEN